MCLIAGRSLDQENTTHKVGRTTIWQESNNEGVVRRLSLLLELRQCRHRSTSGIWYVAAVFRSGSDRIRYQRAIFHHAARSRNESRHAFRLLHLASSLLFWLLTGAAIMSGTRRLTTLASLDRMCGVVGFSCHRIATTEKTAAGHPDRHADRQQQSHYFVREEQTHSAGSLPSGALFCRGSESHQNRHQFPALL